jgi:hypothetical protein
MCSLFAFAAPALAQAQLSSRKEISELSAAELASLRKGVAQMMAWSSEPRGSANYRKSWIYWSNIHGHFGDDCAGPVSDLPGLEGQAPITATGPDELSTWCKCEHGTYGFLVWHRMYLYYFEQALRGAANDPHLTLPYWDYVQRPVIPSSFRESTYSDQAGMARPNPLYVAQRNAGLNSGDKRLDPEVTSVTIAFLQKQYFDGELGFNGALGDSPHGPVHCAIAVAGCGSGLMGSVPVAGQDPIFYLHHAMIDRLYDCWLSGAPSQRLPKDAQWLNRRYAFPDGTGVVRTRAARDMLQSATLGYQYSRTSTCHRGPAAVAQGAPLGLSQAERYLIGGDGNLSASTTVQTLALSDSARAAVRVTPLLASRPRQNLIVVHGLVFNVTPALLYKVYLVNGPRRALLGVIDFFSASGHRGDHSTRPSITFDGTSAFERIGAVANSLAVEFVPTTGIDGETAADVTSLDRADTNLQYESIELIARHN